MALKPLIDGTDKAEVLVFQSVFTNELDTDLPTRNKGPSPYPSMPNIDATIQVIAKILNDLNAHKGLGPDLKETADVVLYNLDAIICT